MVLSGLSLDEDMCLDTVSAYQVSNCLLPALQACLATNVAPQYDGALRSVLSSLYLLQAYMEFTMGGGNPPVIVDNPVATGQELALYAGPGGESATDVDEGPDQCGNGSRSRMGRITSKLVREMVPVYCSANPETMEYYQNGDLEFYEQGDEHVLSVGYESHLQEYADGKVDIELTSSQFTALVNRLVGLLWVVVLPQQP